MSRLGYYHEQPILFCTKVSLPGIYINYDWFGYLQEIVTQNSHTVQSFLRTIPQITRRHAKNKHLKAYKTSFTL